MLPEGTLLVFTNDNCFLSFVNHFDVNYKLNLYHNVQYFLYSLILPVSMLKVNFSSLDFDDMHLFLRREGVWYNYPFIL